METEASDWVGTGARTIAGPNPNKTTIIKAVCVILAVNVFDSNQVGTRQRKKRDGLRISYTKILCASTIHSSYDNKARRKLLPYLLAKNFPLLFTSHSNRWMDVS